MQQAISDIRAIQPASAYEVDTTSAETVFRKIMQDFRAGSKEYAGTIDKLTTEIMHRIVTSLRKQTNHPEKLRGGHTGDDDGCDHGKPGSFGIERRAYDRTA